jgi:hypothetical protein
MGDELAPLAVPGYSPAFLAALDSALRVAPHQRPPSAAAWREAIDGRAEVPAPQVLQAAAPRPAPVMDDAEAPTGRLDIEFADTVQALPEDVPPLPIVPPPARRPPWLLAGAGVLAVALLGAFVLQLRHNLPAAEPAPVDAAASAASVPASPADAVLAASAPAPASAVPVTQVTTVSLAGPASAPRASAAPTSPTPRRESGALKPIITEKAGEFRPVPRSPVFAAPEPAASAAAAPMQAAAASVAAEPRTAAEACGGRVLLARAWCIDRQCEKPQFRNDAECVKLRELRSNHGGVP